MPLAPLCTDIVGIVLAVVVVVVDIVPAAFAPPVAAVEVTTVVVLAVEAGSCKLLDQDLLLPSDRNHSGKDCLEPNEIRHP